MKKIFLSQPMAGRSDEDIERERKDILAKFPNYEEIKSFVKDGTEGNSLKCLARSIELMADADIVVFAPGYYLARGCRIEYDCARCYGKTLVVLSDGGALLNWS